MKKSTFDIIIRKFEIDNYEIDAKIRENKRKINKLAEEQRQLKGVKKGLLELLRLARG